MKGFFTAFFFIITFSKGLFSQEILMQDSLILWNASYHLKWTDFQCENYDSLKIKPDFLNTAYSCIEIEYYLDSTDLDTPKFIVDNYFNRKRSWCSKDPKPDYVLAHEQLHFDIDQLIVRKIRAKLAELNKKRITDEDQYYQAINKLLKEFSTLQSQYDSETAHGLVTNSQNEWRTKIDKELFILKNFKNIQKK